MASTILELISETDSIHVKSDIFKNCFTYRTESSNELINILLGDL